MTTTATPPPLYSEPTPNVEVTVARHGLEEAVISELRQLRTGREHCLLIVQMNRDGTWCIFRGGKAR